MTVKAGATCCAGLSTPAQSSRPYLPASFVTSRRTASGVWSTSPRNRTAPWRPSSARATEIFLLEVSRPTKTALSCCMARPRCVRLGTGLSGATLVRRIARDEPPPLQQRTYGLPEHGCPPCMRREHFPARGRAQPTRLTAGQGQVTLILWGRALEARHGAIRSHPELETQGWITHLSWQGWRNLHQRSRYRRGWVRLPAGQERR